MSAATQVRSLAPLAESLIWWHGGAAFGWRDLRGGAFVVAR